MNKYFYKANIVFLQLVFMCDAFAQLHEPIRRDFLNSAYGSCYGAQRKNPVNSIALDLDIQKYCVCTSVFLANAITNSMVASNVADVLNGSVMPAFIAPFVGPAGRYCQVNYNGFNFLMLK
jgi:hypothetical protein